MAKVKSDEILMTKEREKALSVYLTIDDVLAQVNEIAKAEEWTSVKKTVTQAMYRGHLETAIPRKRGVPPRFTQINIDNYLSYLRTRSRHGGAKKVHKLERFKPLLGIKTDAIIALIAQCSQHTVYTYRTTLNIPSTRTLEEEGRERSKNLTAKDLALVGMTMEEAKVIIDSQPEKSEATVSEG